MAIEKTEKELVYGEAAALEAPEAARRRVQMEQAEREKAAALAELISLRCKHRRHLLWSVDRDPAPAVLEEFYAKHPHLKGSTMFEPRRCSFCGGATREKLSTMIEGYNSARICPKCVHWIAEKLDDGFDADFDGDTTEAA